MRGGGGADSVGAGCVVLCPPPPPYVRAGCGGVASVTRTNNPIRSSVKQERWSPAFRSGARLQTPSAGWPPQDSPNAGQEENEEEGARVTDDAMATIPDVMVRNLPIAAAPCTRRGRRPSTVPPFLASSAPSPFPRGAGPWFDPELVKLGDHDASKICDIAGEKTHNLARDVGPMVLKDRARGWGVGWREKSLSHTRKHQSASTTWSRHMAVLRSKWTSRCR